MQKPLRKSFEVEHVELNNVVAMTYAFLLLYNILNHGRSPNRLSGLKRCWISPGRSLGAKRQNEYYNMKTYPPRFI